MRVELIFLISIQVNLNMALLAMNDILVQSLLCISDFKTIINNVIVLTVAGLQVDTIYKFGFC